MGPLKHLRVLDMSRVLAGPWAGQTFADLGAEVIKVERPGIGDDTRAWGPPYLKDKNNNDTTEAGYFLSANRGKQSITIDLTKPEGQALIRELVAISDVLIENYKVGGLKKYGLDYDSLKTLNPGLIYCSITGFGQTGPYADHPGYDFMIQGMAGIMSVTGERDDLPGGGPQKIGVALADIVTGLYTTIAVQAALLHRQKSGEGQYIDMALFDCQLAVMANQAMNYLVSGDSPTRLGNAHPNIVPYQVFASQDSHLIVAVGNDEQYKRFCKLIGAEHLSDDVRFIKNRDRVKHRDILVPMLEQLMKQKTSQHWLGELRKVAVPCGPINNLEQVFADSQIQHRNMQQQVPHSLVGTAPIVASPMKFSQTPVEHKNAAPLLGEHSDELLSKLLNKSAADIAALRDQKII